MQDVDKQENTFIKGLVEEKIAALEAELAALQKGTGTANFDKCRLALSTAASETMGGNGFFLVDVGAATHNGFGGLVLMLRDPKSGKLTTVSHYWTKPHPDHPLMIPEVSE